MRPFCYSSFVGVETDSMAGARAELSPPTPAFEARRSAVSRRTSRQADIELLRRAGEADAEALRRLCERLAPRVERVVRALFGAALSAADTEDLVSQALVELLRARPRELRGESLERWVDRSAARSAVRRARALPSYAARDERRNEPARDVLPARSFDRYLGLLTAASREALVLRYGFGFSLNELCEVLESPLLSTKERLLAARRELRSWVRPRRRARGRALGLGAERWCALRDREARGDALSVAELEDLAALEAEDPEVWVFAAQLRALERYFDSAKVSDEPAARERVERALAQFASESPAPLLPVADRQVELERLPELEGSRWVRALALLGSVALTAASAAAVYLHRPREPGGRALERAASEPAPRPTVEALASARLAARGAHLRREPVGLSDEAQISQGDVLEAVERGGCIVVEPVAELCLGPSSRVRVASLLAREPRFELQRGRVIARARTERATAVVIGAGESEVIGAGATFGVERDAALQVRTLRGRAGVRTGSGATIELNEGHTANIDATGALQVVALTPMLARRDWELLALSEK